MFHNKNLIIILLLACSCLISAQLSVNLSQASLSPNEATTKASISLPTKNANTTAAPTTKATSTTSSTSTTTTTTTTTTSTTTPAPNTTTAAPITTTAAPITTTTPAPNVQPDVGVWNSSCIMVRMAAQLNFTYETKDDKTAMGLYNIPKDAVVDDTHCSSNTTQFLQVNWGPAEAQHIMLLQFDRMNGTNNLTMAMFTLPLMSDKFPNAKENQTVQLIYRGAAFSVPMKMSYHCTRPQIFNLTETVMDKEVIGTLTVHDVQTEAFRSDSKSGFSTARDCDSSETTDIVPIAVGIALVALILIVLVSYLCARRRSTSRGYMSF